jgi:hypothetical protein
MTNAAYDLGKVRFGWWPDWCGECVAIVASGSSTKGAGVEQLRDRIHVIAIKRNVELCPWAEIVYGCDEAWWRLNNGLPKYQGIKMTQSASVPYTYRDIRRVEVDTHRDDILVERPLVVGNGGNSGFQALNLAVQFGATNIILVGFDMAGEHWHGRNPSPMNNPAASNFSRWLAAFKHAAPQLRAMGVDVVNCSVQSAMKCFPREPLADVMGRWGL